MRRILAVAMVLVIVASAAAFAQPGEEATGTVLALAGVTGGKKPCYPFFAYMTDI